MKILHRDVYVRDVRRELPPEALGYLDNYRDMIERDEYDLECDGAEGLVATPFWDARLKRYRTERLRLYRCLREGGLLSFRTKLKAKAGVFVVKKKDGMQRLIVDARAACAAHHRPPTTRLASLRCMGGSRSLGPQVACVGIRRGLLRGRASWNGR